MNACSHSFHCLIPVNPAISPRDCDVFAHVSVVGTAFTLRWANNQPVASLRLLPTLQIPSELAAEQTFYGVPSGFGNHCSQLEVLTATSTTPNS